MLFGLLVGLKVRLDLLEGGANLGDLRRDLHPIL